MTSSSHLKFVAVELFVYDLRCAPFFAFTFRDVSFSSLSLDRLTPLSLHALLSLKQRRLSLCAFRATPGEENRRRVAHVRPYFRERVLVWPRNASWNSKADAVWRSETDLKNGRDASRRGVIPNVSGRNTPTV